MIQLIKSNGEVTDNFTADTLKEKQDAVGGYIEVVATRKGKVLIVNEEGHMKRLKKMKRLKNFKKKDFFMIGIQNIVITLLIDIKDIKLYKL